MKPGSIPRRPPALAVFILALACARILPAATLTFSSSAPAVAVPSIANWIGAAYDANNVGGSGTNAAGGANNGTANDSSTYVADSRGAQGQTFLTGSNASGYTLNSITVQVAGYSDNVTGGSASNNTYWALSNTSASFLVRVSQVSGTNLIPVTAEPAMDGGTGNPGVGDSANGPGTYLTFALTYPVALQPNTLYAYDIGVAAGTDYFETMGIQAATSAGAHPYTSGSAYVSGASGVGNNTFTAYPGDRVFMVNMTSGTAAIVSSTGSFVHPGLLHSAADFARMRIEVALGAQPWTEDWNVLTANPQAQLGWVPNPQTVIYRGGPYPQNYPILYNDIAAAYADALRWEVSGDTRYADQAVAILNAWGSTLTSVWGDTNMTLAGGIYGYEFANVAEIMRTYPGWSAAGLAQFQTMMYNAFYWDNNDFLVNHHNTQISHYWANWDLCSIASMQAIGVLMDNTAIYNQATNYFEHGYMGDGSGNGCVQSLVYYMFPGYLGQVQEAGRDQGHATLDVAMLGPICQTAWNQGLDLFGYDNNRVLATVEYVAKYNLFNPVPYVPYNNVDNVDQTVISSNSQGTIRPCWELFYNHYVNIKGMAAPYTSQFAAEVRPEGGGGDYGPNSGGYDQLGYGTLTCSLPPIATGTNPSGLTATLTAGEPVLSWWGSAYATSYNVKRGTTSGGPYTTVASGISGTLTYTDTTATTGTYYYVVTGTTPTGMTGVSNEASICPGLQLQVDLSFNQSSGTTAYDSTGNGWNGTLSTGTLSPLPVWTSGGEAGNYDLSLDGTDNYVSLPAGVVSNLGDFTVSAWVYLNSSSQWARIFDFGTGVNFYMMLTTNDGSSVSFQLGTVSYYNEEVIDGASIYPLGKWTHVAVTDSGGVGTLYINGIAVGGNVEMPFSPSFLGTSTTNNWIGRSQWSPPVSTDPYLNARVDDFRIYSGAMSPAAVYTLATGGQPPAAPAAPASLSATTASASQINLSWTPSAGATSYNVERGTSSGGPYALVATVVTGTGISDKGLDTSTGLVSGATYYYVVSAVNGGGQGANSGQASATLPPAAPASLSGSGASFSQINLSWTASYGATSYDVLRSSISGGPYTLIASGVTGTKYSDTSGLASATIYYYVVSAQNAGGVSPISVEANAIAEIPLAGTLIGTTGTANAWEGNAATTAAAAMDGNFATYYDAAVSYGDWVGLDLGTATVITEVSYAPRVGYEGRMIGGEFQGSNTANFSSGVVTLYTITAAPPDNVYTDAYISNSTAFRYVRYIGPSGGYCDVAEIAFWNPDSAPEAPAAPATLSAASGNTVVSLSWPASSLATSYNVKRSTTSGGEVNVATEVTGTTYTDSGLTNGTTYYYEVSAMDAGGESGVSPEASAVPLAPPANLVAMPGNAEASLVWTPTAGAGYNVERSGTSGGPYSTVASGVTATSYIDTGLTNGATYYYVVVAVSGSSTSANSAQASVVPGSTGPAAYLRFDETSGTTAADSTGNGWNGSCWNSPAWVAGKINNALSLNGTNNYVTLRSGVVSAFTDFTISAWVKLNSVSNWARVFDFGTGTTDYMFLTAENGNDNVVRFAITTGGNPAEQRIDGASPLASGTWTLVAVTLSGSTGTLYVNGAPVGSNTNMTLNPYSLGATNLNYIGKSQFSADPYLNGVVDEFRIYGRALSATEIGELASPPAPPSGVSALAGDNEVTLNWNPAATGTGYNIYRGTTSGGPYATAAAGVTGTTYTDSSVANGTAYYYVLTTVNGDAESGNSAEVSAIPSPPISAAEQNGAVASIVSNGAGGIEAAMTVQGSVIGHTYQLQSATDLVDAVWQNVGAAQAGTGGVIHFTTPVSPTAPRCFYRILIQQ